MDSDDLVIVESERSTKPPPDPLALLQMEMALKARREPDSDEESEPDLRPIIHTNVPVHNGKYRHHNYLRDTNDNCAHCHAFLLQAYREKRISSMSPPPPMALPVLLPKHCLTKLLSYHAASSSSAASSSNATDAS
jgi:hypothetical protein